MNPIQPNAQSALDESAAERDVSLRDIDIAKTMPRALAAAMLATPEGNA